MSMGTRLAGLLVVLTILIVASCSDSTAPEPVPVGNPVPVLLSASMTTLMLGSEPTTVSLVGSGFTSASRARWNDADRTTTFVTAEKLSIALTAADLATAAVGRMSVFNPAPGGGASNAIDLSVTNPVPFITALTPDSVPTGSAFTLQVDGTGLVPGSVIRWSGADRPTVHALTPSGASQLSASIPASDAASATTATITVFNMAPGGGSSAGLPLRVRNPTAPTSNPIPALISASPATLLAGTGETTLTLTGSGFVSASRVRWNGADRVTTYVDATTLSAQIAAADLATPSVAKLSVFNPAPGGGASSDVDLTIKTAPGPGPGPAGLTIASISPSTVISGASDPVNVQVMGTGFTAQSTIRWNSQVFLVPTNITPTTLTVALQDQMLRVAAGTNKIVVLDAASGSESNAADFVVVNPVPVILSLSPDTALTGSGYTLRFTGRNMTLGSVLRWNGVDRPTTYSGLDPLGTSPMRAEIPASDVAAAGTATITVFNPAPGGGTSAPVSLRVRDAAPLITSLNPSTIQAGAAGATVTITGANFSSASTVQWNGQLRQVAFGSATSLAMTLTAADVSTPGTGQVVVVNPGTSGASNVMGLAVLPVTSTLAVTNTIALPNDALVYDATRTVLYAAVPSTGGARANTVTKIDPATGTILSSVAIGGDPGAMAISDDDQYLYVALDGAPIAFGAPNIPPKVIRINLVSFTKDIEIVIGTDVTWFAEDLEVPLGQPRSVVIALASTGGSPRHKGLVIYDDAVMRPKSVPRGFSLNNRIVRGPTATRLYTYENEGSIFGFHSILIAPDGLTDEGYKSFLINGFRVDIEYGDGLVYATSGEVVNPLTLTSAGKIPTTGVVRPDASNARVHYFSSSEIRSYHYTSYVGLGTFTSPALAGMTTLVRWGRDGLAAGGGASLVLMRGSLVAP
jgi:hypothetical protein